jgi:hypothetical protein
VWCAGGGLRIGRRREFRFPGVLKGRDAVVHGAGTNPRRWIHGEVGHVGVGMHHLRGASGNASSVCRIVASC